MIRENTKLAAFVIGGAIVGAFRLSVRQLGWYISPTVFALGQSVQVIIWVVVGGVGTLSERSSDVS
jgi:branched-chain amino acid transport system permease protein